MSGSEQETMNALWKQHRSAGGMFRVFAAGGGMLVADMAAVPPRIWAGRTENGLLRMRVDDVPGAFAGEGAADKNPEMLFARIWAGEHSSELSPPDAAAFMGEVPGRESWADLSVRRFVESVQDARLRGRLPVDKMKEAEVARLEKTGVAAFRAALDMEAINVLSAVENYSWREYSYYAVNGPEGSIDAFRRTVRHQAARSYPMLAGLITARFGIKADLEKQAKFLMDRMPLKARMDAAKESSNAEEIEKVKILMDALPKPVPLLESLEKAFTPPPSPGNLTPKPIISKAALNRIGGIPFTPSGLRPEVVAMNMSELPPDWFPRKGTDWKVEEWTAFTDLVATVGVTLKRITGSGPEILYEGCGGKWADMRDRIVKAFTDSRPPGGDEAAVEAIHAAIDWKEIRKLPPLKVQAAAVETASRLKEMLPEGMTEQDVSNWIVRIISPVSTRDVIANACAETEAASSTLCNRVMLPLAVTLTGDGDPILTHEQFEFAGRISSDILFKGKSAVKVFETMSAFHQNSALIMSGGTVLTAELELQAEEARRQRERREFERQRRDAAVSAMAVGVDPEAAKEFPVAFAPVIIAPNGVHICVLTNRRMFEDEGRGYGVYGNGILPHRGHERNDDGSFGLVCCVGQAGHYYDDAFRGRSVFFSARIPAGADAELGAPYTRLGIYKTSQFAQENGTWVSTRQEYRGYRNGGTPEIANTAFAWFFEQIKQGRIAHTLGDITAEVQKQTARIDRIEDICGYNWREYPRVVGALAPWMPVMNKRTRLGIAGFSKLPEVIALSDSISPGWRQKAEMRDEAWGRETYTTGAAP